MTSPTLRSKSCKQQHCDLVVSKIRLHRPYFFFFLFFVFSNLVSKCYSTVSEILRIILIPFHRPNKPLNAPAG